MADCPNCGQPVDDDNCRYMQVDAVVIAVHEDCAAIRAQATPTGSEQPCISCDYGVCEVHSPRGEQL